MMTTQEMSRHCERSEANHVCARARPSRQVLDTPALDGFVAALLAMTEMGAGSPFAVIASAAKQTMSAQGHSQADKCRKLRLPRQRTGSISLMRHSLVKKGSSGL
jgi:hypothetical protein